MLVYQRVIEHSKLENPTVFYGKSFIFIIIVYQHGSKYPVI